MDDTLEIPTAAYTIRLRSRDYYEQSPAPRIYVADDVAAAASADLAEYTRQERELGSRRWAKRGQYAEVDALYDLLNQTVMDVKTGIARDVLALLPPSVEGNLVEAVTRASFSREAGCDICPCSPGVVAGTKLLWRGGEFDVWVESAR